MGKAVRLDKFLADAGAGTRSEVKKYIQKGKVRINGVPAKKPEIKVSEEDEVILDGNRVSRAPEFVYYLLHKPAGYVSATEDKRDRTVMELVPSDRKDMFPVGRLDKNSEGLLLFTNDGNFANNIMHPAKQISKTYRVTVRPNITDEQLVALSDGIELDGRKTLPANVVVKDKEQGRVVLLITIKEGRNRQIRRMCEAVGLEVARLRRISIGPLKLGMLNPGTYRELTADELRAIRNAIGKDVK